MSGRRRLVVGVGQAVRGDDGVGPAVVDALRGSLPDDVSVVVCADGAGLTDVLPDCDVAVIVDAIQADVPVGTVTRVPTAALVPELFSPQSTHTLGVVQALGMLEAIGQLPATVIVVGVCGDRFERGAPMSPAVAAAIPAAMAMVRAALDEVSGLSASPASEPPHA